MNLNPNYTKDNMGWWWWYYNDQTRTDIFGVPHILVHGPYKIKALAEKDHKMPFAKRIQPSSWYRTDWLPVDAL